MERGKKQLSNTTPNHYVNGHAMGLFRYQQIQQSLLRSHLLRSSIYHRDGNTKS